MKTNFRGAIWLAVLALALPLFNGCKTKTCDARGPSDTCEIHHAFMESVKIPYAKKEMPPMDYLEARARFFPHAYPFLLPEKCPQTMVYICDDCVTAESAWYQWRATQKK